MKRKTVLLTAALLLASVSLPAAASGSRDTEDAPAVDPESVLHIVGEKPAEFGEGGGSGASRVPEGFAESGYGSEVQAALTVLGGKLKVSGGRGKRSFKLKAQDGITYILQVQEEKTESLAQLKGRNIKARGVFYGNTFLAFDFVLTEN